jgi:hypothetical protein
MVSSEPAETPAEPTYFAEEPSAFVHDPNPYAAPQTEVAEPPRDDRLAADLTPSAAAWAESLAKEAEARWVLLLVGLICCQPILLLMLPWYGFRLWNWHVLNASYSELRHPNSFSPHGELAARFQEAHAKLVVGMVMSAIGWVLLWVSFYVPSPF